MIQFAENDIKLSHSIGGGATKWQLDRLLIVFIFRFLKHRFSDVFLLIKANYGRIAPESLAVNLA